MRRWVALVVLFAVLASSCGELVPSGDRPPSEDTAAVYATALRTLIDRDNTFGADHRFSEILIQENLDPTAGRATGYLGPGRPLDETERMAIEAAFAADAMSWIADPRDWRTGDLQPVIPGSVIVGVGSARFDDEGAVVPVSLWCGGTCGLWASYRLGYIDGEWTVVDFEGTIAIS